jgi:hypothetical protein
MNSAGIAVMPPRASPMKKRLRRILPFGRLYAQASEAAKASRVARVAVHMPQTSALRFYLQAGIPGWPHFARGQKIRGHLFLWSFLVTLFLGLLLTGSTTGGILIGLAFSIHSSAIMDLVNQEYPQASVRERMGRGLGVSLILFVAIYWPIGMGIAVVAAPYTVGVPLHPFETGDVVLASTLRAPRPGDVVLYEIPTDRQNHEEGHIIHVMEGRNIDRILAGPGSVFECRNGMLLVNGNPCRWQPLNPIALDTRAAQTVPAGDFLILPSDESGMLTATGNFENLSFISSDAILGRVYLRTQPWRRFAVIR